METQQLTHRATCWRPSKSDSSNSRLALTIAQQLQLEYSRRLAAAAAATASGSSTATRSRENRAPAARPLLPRMGTRVPVSQVATLTPVTPRLLSNCIGAGVQFEPVAVPAAPDASTESRRSAPRRSATANLWCEAPHVAMKFDSLHNCEPELEADAQLDVQEAEWIMRRRPDGSQYVEKREAKRAAQHSHSAFVLSKAAQQRRELLSRRAAQVTAERSMLSTEASEEEEEASGVGADRRFVTRAARREHLDARRASRSRRDLHRRLQYGRNSEVTSGQCGHSEGCKSTTQPLSRMADSFVALAFL